MFNPSAGAGGNDLTNFEICERATSNFSVGQISVWIIADSSSQRQTNSTRMWLDISIAISCAVAGLGCGWVMHAIGFFGDADPNTLVTLNRSNEVTEKRLEKVAQGRVSEVAGRLHDYAATMAMDVDAHQSRVQAVNNSLQNHSDDGTTEAIYRAVDELIAANDSMQEKLRIAQERIQEQTAQLESAEQMAHTDGLTHIANRRAFDDHLDEQFDKGIPEAGTLAILDVDHFKKFNDTYGHRAGDEVLKTVASILNARLNPYGIAARFGGEEFAIVMDGISVENAAEIVNHARIAVGERDVHFGEKRLRVTMSAGLAELLPSESKEDWLQRADDALYRSKAEGRDCTHWMNNTMPIRVGASSKKPANFIASDNSQNIKESNIALNAPVSVNEARPEHATTAKVDGEIVSNEVSLSAISSPAKLAISGTTSTEPVTDHSVTLESSTKDHVPHGGVTADAATDVHADENTTNQTTARSAEISTAESEPEHLSAAKGTHGRSLSTSDVERGDSNPINATQAKDTGDEHHKDAGNKNADEISKRERRVNPNGSGPRAFNYLPDADALAEAMKDLHERSQSANIPLHVMAIRFDHDAGKSTTRALLQIVRATLRSVDRIGCDDECTLLVCMPNLGPDAALERARQICHSAESLSVEETDGEEPCHVSIGLADAANDSNFAQIVSRVKLAADKARADGTSVQFADKDA